MSAGRVTRETPIGTPVVFDIAPYPQGYAMGAEPTGETARGTLHTVEGDAGIAWCFVRVDPRDRGDGGEFHHVPMDRVRIVQVDRPADHAAALAAADLPPLTLAIVIDALSVRAMDFVADRIRDDGHADLAADIVRELLGDAAEEAPVFAPDSYRDALDGLGFPLYA